MSNRPPYECHSLPLSRYRNKSDQKHLHQQSFNWYKTLQCLRCILSPFSKQPALCSLRNSALCAGLPGHIVEHVLMSAQVAAVNQFPNMSNFTIGSFSISFVQDVKSVNVWAQCISQNIDQQWFIATVRAKNYRRNSGGTL